VAAKTHFSLADSSSSVIAQTFSEKAEQKLLLKTNKQKTQQTTKQTTTSCCQAPAIQ